MSYEDRDYEIRPRSRSRGTARQAENDMPEYTGRGPAQYGGAPARQSAGGDDYDYDAPASDGRRGAYDDGADYTRRGGRSAARRETYDADDDYDFDEPADEQRGRRRGKARDEYYEADDEDYEPVRRGAARGAARSRNDDYEDEDIDDGDERYYEDDEYDEDADGAFEDGYDEYSDDFGDDGEPPRDSARSRLKRKRNNDRLAVIITLAVLLAIMIPVSISMGWFGRSISDNSNVLQPAVTSAPEYNEQPTFVQATPTDIPTIEPSQPTMQAALPTASPAVSGQGGNFETIASTGRTLDRSKKAIALTFDDGPSKYSLEIIDILQQHGGLCTFFVVGERLEEYSNTLQAEHAAKCQIGSHTYSHPNLREISTAEITEQVNKTNELVKRYIGEECTILRPPFGAINETVKATVPVPMIKWSIDSRDWDYKDADKVYNVIMESVVDGDIILMHDMYPSTVEAVRRIVPELVAQGYQLCTIDELFHLKHVSLHPGSAWLSAKGEPNY